MNFSEAVSIVQSTLHSIGSDIATNLFDGLIVKKLEASNTLDIGRSTNQTHIAITGKQMDIFPYVRADGYFEINYDEKEEGLKKFFVLQVPVTLYRQNVLYLDSNAELFTVDNHVVHVSIVRSRRNNASDQIQMSLINMDSPEYIKFRNLVHAKDYMILLKRMNQLLYDLFIVRESDENEDLRSLNGSFFNLPTSTPIKINEITAEAVGGNRELLDINQSRECARKLIDYIYDADKLERIKTLLINNEKYVQIQTAELGGRYLSSVFTKPIAKAYNDLNRTYDDKEYEFTFNQNDEKCRLTKEWMSIDLNNNSSTSNNYLLALIKIINCYYSDLFNIYEEEGKWYIEQTAVNAVKEHFILSELPDILSGHFAKRLITSLVAKPFVILTGNSGTGKTRIAKQLAEYLEVRSNGNDKNWILVPVGADWTDNTKILGFYNPLANEGKGKYEKTEILNLIERANLNKDKPYFIILDEMNLSHVERYFADFLSHMETIDIPFILDGYDGIVEYPRNLFVIGTVNIDETTYMFSPKVLDRANVIEFKPDEESVLSLFVKPANNKAVIPASDGSAEAFLQLATNVRSDVLGLDETILEQAEKLFRDIYRITEKKGFEFAYRTVKEIRHYIIASYELLEDKRNFDITAAEDEQLLQKVLPKIHGNKKEIGPLLEELEVFCDQNHFINSCEKIKQMKGRLASVQYASFI